MTTPLLDNLTRADQIEAAWREFHRLNPLVWRLYEQFTFDLIRAGHQHGSSDMVLHRIRWETALKVNTSEVVKINNNFSSLYSRLFAHSYPNHSEFFVKRKRISENKPAYNVDVEVHDGGPAENEAPLDYRMTELAHSNTREFSRP